MRTLAKFEFERDVFFFLGVGGRGRSPWNPPTPRDEGGGVGVNKRESVRSYLFRKKELKTII